ncbi:MAG: hypothetical protein NC200_07550 [Candidatus Gastranaerophilales bacterium]|nr:hypothetical protein [Candidatus Gastranaerophilales bacterium]
MAVGAQDRIDKLLVKKYAKEQVDNHDLGVASMVDPEKMMEAMNDYAAVQRNMLMMSNRIADLCSGIKAKARYATKPIQARN